MRHANRETTIDCVFFSCVQKANSVLSNSRHLNLIAYPIHVSSIKLKYLKAKEIRITAFLSFPNISNQCKSKSGYDIQDKIIYLSSRQRSRYDRLPSEFLSSSEGEWLQTPEVVLLLVWH